MRLRQVNFIFANDVGCATPGDHIAAFFDSGGTRCRKATTARYAIGPLVPWYCAVSTAGASNNEELVYASAIGSDVLTHRGPVRRSSCVD